MEILDIGGGFPGGLFRSPQPFEKVYQSVAPANIEIRIIDKSQVDTITIGRYFVI